MGFSCLLHSFHWQIKLFLFAWMWSFAICLTRSSCVPYSLSQSVQWQCVSIKSGSSLPSPSQSLAEVAPASSLIPDLSSSSIVLETTLEEDSGLDMLWNSFGSLPTGVKGDPEVPKTGKYPVWAE